ncbi:hypothetical protein GT204_02755 [Streptomyces sp. SID4919]|uniref:ATP-binding protein n=1 Tax=Streptomyces TaxID=1883 RepID=UPI000823A455|nr:MULTISPECIES: ATP-binding protein [Streptomyces]MYY07843.1 hypothetical protein [Streptomyces sp. SID4919]SCK06252.1 Histidine kinase-like ATPase domain [Streptomyces sp. AmelKG-E11A]
MTDDEPPTRRPVPPGDAGAGERPRTLSRWVEAGPEGPRQARSHTRAALARWRVDPQVTDTATLLMSELVTHAVRHRPAERGLPSDGRVHCQVQHWPGGTVRLTVQSGPCVCMPGQRGAHSRESTPGSPHSLREHPRGLEIVEALSGAWGTRDSDHHQVVWVEL